jgi:hypothetical protein
MSEQPTAVDARKNWLESERQVRANAVHVASALFQLGLTDAADAIKNFIALYDARDEEQFNMGRLP